MYSFPSNCQVPNLSFVYETMFGNKKGLFVEVGAYNGQDFSNTSGLADNGWEGIYIEPIPNMMTKCKLRHKNNNCKFVQKAIGSASGEITLHIGGTLTTFNQEHFEIYKQLDWAKNDLTEQQVTVELVTLNSVFEENALGTCDVLIIDVEGSEHEVMVGFDLEKYKPKIVIIEIADQHPDLAKMICPETAEKCRLLRERFDRLYDTLYKDTINTVYLRKSD